MKVKDVISYLDNRFPIELASEFDYPRVGFNIGNINQELSSVMLSLDLTKDVILEACNLGCNLIITHHSYLFDPLYKIDFEANKGQIIGLLYKNKVSVYSMHTNFDVGKGGVNDTLAKMIGIKNIKVINNEIKANNFLRYGEIEEISFDNLIKKVKSVFNLTGVRAVGNMNDIIKSVGIVGGSGGHKEDFINALNANIDCYITGEIPLNIAIDAKELNLKLIEVNHGIEKFAFETLKIDLEQDLKLKEKVFITSINTDPLVFV
ncbi:MAG: Nif3-like dinuclear metal center hexameric protein [Bacilli bacterium]|jgi:dinuclear metal center YbgI/SA1388 family protein|nr:Nif3-like dinuclear metal center hexameric protein [Bacilli bacterium]MDD2682065.1 Nif3-like dinuclear metal center hexameric protein [Bacilli bacterium]MDD3121490.1 Nif3-like dinuclear metal center hexameric protein [Bacilli bacterium]MDD4063571.1 Nif3-like dinuclear metal center hexameric protein [Bacilli bacterium]MDD4482029.1 Nif3-like dinuclear metal center hexameric protein [Bacilli bacterium]